MLVHPEKMTPKETGDFPAVAPQGNVLHKKPRLRHARTPGGIPDTNDIYRTLQNDCTKRPWKRPADAEEGARRNFWRFATTGSAHWE